MKADTPKHQNHAPTARKIRRTCSRELYRTVKRLKVYLSPALIKEGEELYFRKVALNLPYIAEHTSNRKLLADWFEENIAPELSALWKLEAKDIADAFRDAFGG
ncbi:hypothetical protein [Gorillibacterium massiliense]|uniref:hypothetical protein n=1 Tax=Gorillibacterium massiliense TaxID=1280390 RepID=UPI0004B49C01|nr:hypothetical protein [Gorillibacterium massiliense]